MSKRTTRRCRLLPALGLLASTHACSPPDHPTLPDTIAGPQLTLVDSVDLRETDSAFVAVPIDLLVASGGEILVSDRPTARVLRFNRAGILQKVYGKKGRGPGEIMWTTSLIPVGDSLLIVGDDNLHRMTYFRMTTGEPLQSIPYEGRLKTGVVDGDSIRLGTLRRSTPKLLTTLGSVAVFGREIRYSHPVPRVYAERDFLQGAHGTVHVARVGHVLTYAYQAMADMFLLRPDGTVDTVSVPSVRRVPQPLDLMKAFSEASLSRMTLAERARITSLTWSTSALPGGRLAVIHADLRRETREPEVAAAWLTVVDRGFTEACIDGRIPVSGQGYARFTFAADTLVILDQLVDGLKVRTRIRRFLPDLSSCEWVPLSLRRGGEEPSSGPSAD